MAPKEEASFEHSARYYEVLANATKRLEREAGLLTHALETAPGTRVLDLACGTGVHSLWFAERGAAVCAVDLSEAMLAYARVHRAHQRVSYVAADMRRPPDGAWDLAICLGNSLSLLASEDDLREAFEAVFERLADEGVFLFQTLNYERAQAREARHRVERRPLDAGELVAVKSLVPHGNRTLLTLNFFADGESGVDTVSDAAVLRNWTRDELVATGEAAGFGVEGVWGGVDMRGYEAGESPDVIALLRKK